MRGRALFYGKKGVMISRPFLLVFIFLRNSLVAVLVPAFLYTPVQAAPYSNNTRIALSLMDFGYQEFDDNDVILNREDGYLPGLTLSVDAPASRCTNRQTNGWS